MFGISRYTRPFRGRISNVIRTRRKRGTRSSQSSVTPASVVFSNESPDLIDGTDNFVTFSSRGTIAGAAGNGYRISLYSDRRGLWKTILWQSDGTKVIEKATSATTLADHITEINSFMSDYVNAVVTGTIPNTVTYSPGTGFSGSVAMSGGVG